MSTDRELLELAAKAAGIGGFWVDAGLNIGSNAAPRIWNPLTDDGDALRLAVKLKLCVDTGAMTRSNQTYVGGSGGYLADEKHGPDEYAATRRAALAQPAPQPLLTIERLRDALVASRIVPPAAVEDPDEYDDGVTLHRIEALHRRITG